MKLPRKRSIETAFWCAFIASAVFCVFESLMLRGDLEMLELKAYDLWLNAQPADSRMSNKIVIIYLREEEARKLGKPYPLRDDQLMELFDKLMPLHPAAVGIDLFRDQEMDVVVTPAAR